MKKLLQNISDSFKVTDGGYSGRKLTAFSLMACIVALHIMYILTPEYGLLVSILVTDLVGVGFFLGLVTVANIIELKNGNVVKTEDNIK